MRASIFAAILLLSACGGKEPEPPAAAGGAVSPTGDKHPGDIVHDDKVDGRVWTRKAAEVPVSIAWVELDGKWVPVVRIEITGTAEKRAMSAFGPGGRFLQRTVQGP